MDLDPRGEKRCESPYRDYYSTGGCYRPPKRRRSYGWLAAVLGFFLLCAAAYIAMDRRGAAPEGTMRQHDLDTEQVTAAVLPSDPAAPEETAALTPAAEPLAGEFRMTISSGSGRKMELPDIYKKVIPSVVSITTLTPGGNATGTGIVLSEDGYLVTNYHVISGAEEIRALLTSGEEYRAAMVGWDETSDLAVLKIDAEGLTPAEFGSSDSMEVGDAVVAIGDPLGTELRGTMTDGIICGIQRDVHVGDRTMSLMQTNAALNSGNSGGPLVNMAGQVIGINTMKLKSNYTPVEGIGFAIPVTAAGPILEELAEKGYVSGRPAVGFSLEVLSDRLRLFYDLPGNLYIRQVAENSDAYAQGIRAGDVIVAIEGTEVSTLDEFNTIKNQFKAGDTVTLTVFHKGGEMDVRVTLMDRADLQ